MLTFKPFFIHGCRNKKWTDSGVLRHAPRGFTIFVHPSDTERCVDISWALCHYKDEFSRKNGRTQAYSAEMTKINARDLPRFIEKLAKKAHCGHSNYDYVLKYVV